MSRRVEEFRMQEGFLIEDFRIKKPFFYFKKVLEL